MVSRINLLALDGYYACRTDAVLLGARFYRIIWDGCLQTPLSSPSEHDRVFCRTDGQPLRRAAVLNHGLHPALRRAKLRGGNIKTLRHSYASGLIAAGAPITEVQHRLGHSSPAITLKVYSHWFKDADTGAADRFAAGFLRPSSAHLVPTLGSTGVIRENVKPAKTLRK